LEPGGVGELDAVGVGDWFQELDTTAGGSWYGELVAKAGVRSWFRELEDHG